MIVMVVMVNMVHMVLFLMMLFVMVMGADFPGYFLLHRMTFFMINRSALLVRNLLALLVRRPVGLVLGDLPALRVHGVVTTWLLFVVSRLVLSCSFNKVDNICRNIPVVISCDMGRVGDRVLVVMNLGH